MSERRLHLFEGYGIEIEFMVVDRETLAVRPIVDDLLAALTGGEVVCDATVGQGIGASNELVLHVFEMKNEQPEADLGGLVARFESAVARVNTILSEHGAMLVEGGMHPLMRPETETRIWPHDYGEVYAAYDALFNCRRHGWSNVQSVHINLPFGDDEEFGRLHAAIRLVLPLIPGLAASSPYVEGGFDGTLDRRLTYYATNSSLIPEVTGMVVPEAVFTPAEYQSVVLEPIGRAVRERDENGVLAGHEWMNARGAIARFDRNAIEIRLVDAQENPAADLAVAAAVSAVVKGLVEEQWCSFTEQKAWAPEPLAAVLGETIIGADRTVIRNKPFLRAFGHAKEMKAGDLWTALIAESAKSGRLASSWLPKLAVIRDHGTLARRILAVTKEAARPDKAALDGILRQMALDLDQKRSFGVSSPVDRRHV